MTKILFFYLLLFYYLRAHVCDITVFAEKHPHSPRRWAANPKFLLMLVG